MLSVNKRAEILAVSGVSFLQESREERCELKGEGESSLAPKVGLILRLTVKRDKMYTSKSNNIPLKRKTQIQESETVTNNPASASFRVCDCRAHAVLVRCFAQWSVFICVASIYANLLEQKKAFT